MPWCSSNTCTSRPGNVYVPGGIGVYYDQSADRWTIFRENPLDAMPSGARFNVLVVKQ